MVWVVDQACENGRVRKEAERLYRRSMATTNGMRISPVGFSLVEWVVPSQGINLTVVLINSDHV